MDYDGASNFLLREQSNFYGEKFSLLKLNEGGNVLEIIAFGSAEDLFTSLSGNSGRRLLND